MPRTYDEYSRGQESGGRLGFGKSQDAEGPSLFPLRFRLRTLMILVIPTVAIGAWTYRVLPKCPVHGTVMWRGSVPIRYGLVMFSASGLEYREARTSLFPNCDDAVLGG